MASEKAIDHGALMLCERDNSAGAACEPRCEMCKLIAKQVLDAAARVDGVHVDAGEASSAVDGDAQWKPIETAPKDGTIVDLWLDIYASPMSMGLSDAFRVIECWYEEGKWVHRVESGAVKALNMNYITHWMLPPTPPSVP